MTFEEAKRLLEQVESFGKPRPIFIFTGGDPFKRQDLFDLLAYGDELGLAMAVSPSGTPLLTEENLLKVRKAGGKAISLSIDGSNAERHDQFRGVPGGVPFDPACEYHNGTFGSAVSRIRAGNPR